MLLLLRQFITPFSYWQWPFRLAIALLPVVVVIGLVAPSLAFGLAVWDYVILLAIPFMLAPKVLRSLLCNRQLALVPGLGSKAVLAALLFTLAQAGFIGAFATLFDIPGDHLRNAALLFIVSSLYVAVMQFAVTTSLAVPVLSLLPLACVALILVVVQGKARHLVGDDHLLALMVATLLGWTLAGWRVGKHHHFQREHASVRLLNPAIAPRHLLSAWLVAEQKALQAPDATLLFGYPANLASRLRVLLYQVFFGPLVATGFLAMVGYGQQWSLRPTAFDLFLVASLFPATFGIYSNIDTVARLRQFWLRSARQRSALWALLEKQFAVQVLLLGATAVVITIAAIPLSNQPVALLWHYPVLITLFNAFYAYYLIIARCSGWSPLRGVLVSTAGSAVMTGALWLAVVSRSTPALFVLEALVVLAIPVLRVVAMQKVAKVDWLLVKPAMAKLAN